MCAVRKHAVATSAKMSLFQATNTFLNCVQTALCCTICLQCCAAASRPPPPNYIVVKEDTSGTSGTPATNESIVALATNGAVLPLLSMDR